LVTSLGGARFLDRVADQADKLRVLVARQV